MYGQMKTLEGFAVTQQSGNFVQTDMMDTCLRDYIKIYKGFYDPAFCNSVVSDLEKASWKQHTFYDNINKKHISFENELSISHDKISLKKELDEKIWHVIEKYVVKDMKHMHSWYSGWSGYTPSRFNKYDTSTQMKLHCDHITSMFDGERKGIPTLTVLGALNEGYEGGELILCGEQVELKTGDVIVFPSNFLYPHEVKQVKSGTRYSFVSWVW